MGSKDFTEQEKRAFISMIRWSALSFFFTVGIFAFSIVTITLVFTDTDPLPAVIAMIGCMVLSEYANRMARSAHKEWCENCRKDEEGKHANHNQ